MPPYPPKPVRLRRRPQGLRARAPRTVRTLRGAGRPPRSRRRASARGLLPAACGQSRKRRQMPPARSGSLSATGRRAGADTDRQDGLVRSVSRCARPTARAAPSRPPPSGKPFTHPLAVDGPGEPSQRRRDGLDNPRTYLGQMAQGNRHMAVILCQPLVSRKIALRPRGNGRYSP